MVKKMKRKKWMISGCDTARAKELSARLGLTHLASCALCARGIDTPAAAEEFMQTDLSGLHDPMQLRDMDKAVDLIGGAVQRGEKIAIYGDYDVDGVTATCVMTRYLTSVGADCIYYIPNRMNEGYGLNAGAIQTLFDAGVRLLITVDSGITAVEETAFAHSLGMRVVITDHHECKEELPGADAVLNPRRTESGYPFRELAGVGVAFKLVCALAGPDQLQEMIEQYLALVAVGTVADVMPLCDENRVIVANGLACLERTDNPGLRALMECTGMRGKTLTSNAISFILAPRINAAGRIGCALTAARLFLTDDTAQAQALAEQLCEQNRERQAAENSILEEVLEQLSQQYDAVRDRVIVLWGEDWHNGVVGIVSSRITDRYGVPAILISLEGDMGKGSGRSVKGFNLFGALEDAAPLLLKYGGHELAVGLSIEREQLEAFRTRINAYAAEHYSAEEAEPSITIDCEVSAAELTLANVDGLKAIEPFGMGNPQPVFCIYGARVEEITPLAQDKHLKLRLTKDGTDFYALCFGMSTVLACFAEGDFIDVAFSPEINVFRNTRSVQLVVRDLRRSASEDEKDARYFALYQNFRAGERVSAADAALLHPTRDDLVAVFRFVRKNAEKRVLNAECGTLCRRINREIRNKLNPARLLICLDIFSEFGLFAFRKEEDMLHVEVLPFEGKADINGSRILRRINDIRGSQDGQ